MRITIVVHTTRTRSEGRAWSEQCQSALLKDNLGAEAAGLIRYVLIPDQLIIAFAHDPLTVGVYVAIARLSLAARGAVPLAARDLVRWMGSDRDADRAAIMRRIVKLEKDGFLIAERAVATKHRLTPTWGRDQAGTARPWRFEEVDTGRPSFLRGRRVPLALLDDYLGRLDPQSGQGRALISRYLTRPLLDLTDIGVYTIGLRAEIAPTSRLLHFGLCSEAGMLPPLDNHSLLALAATGQLTTLVGDMMVGVRLSVQGHTRLGAAAPTVAQRITSDNEHVCGSIRGSSGGSVDGSRERPGETSASADEDGTNSVSDTLMSLIAWDVGILLESTNHDSAPDHILSEGGGGRAALDTSVAESGPPMLSSTAEHQYQLSSSNDDLTCNASSLVAGVVAGHSALNPDRPILEGEWYELLTLQQAHGVEQLLIWQARASRAVRERPHGITPAYYRACAAQAAFETYRPSIGLNRSAAVAHQPVAMPTRLDPRCDALLRTMDVRERQKLADVPYDLIVAWQTALGHPGMAVQCITPLGFAVAQMQRGNAPPSIEELDRWAARAQRKDDRYETWRHIDAPSITVDAVIQEQELEARVRAIAPPDTDLVDLCALARALEAGATDAEALARLRVSRREAKL
jgi:hypothetical protein